jgi:hypothetical protein
MPTTHIEARIVAVRLQTNEGQPIWVDIDPRSNVDAVFTSKDVVRKILIPFYQGDNPDRAEELSRELDRQIKESGICFLPHQASCRISVPPIVRGQGSPIQL